MIQDMLVNEFYVGAYKDGSAWRTNKYSDVSQFPHGSVCCYGLTLSDSDMLSCFVAVSVSYLRFRVAKQWRWFQEDLNPNAPLFLPEYVVSFITLPL
ncbi:hypothetical protein F2Q69_00012094 [Brassica cretica]|uniref:Uncharacterized protein n=1 Tax=Brassica cretica TaxID=69181 RepID=A0A8S9R3D4_BRACR|nr:hypothetical protein F2Q69_00012094 [Brassica cretica]